MSAAPLTSCCNRPSDAALNAALWEHVRAEPERWHATADLACRLGCSEHTVSNDVAALQAFGCGIEWHPYHGIRFSHPSERLCPDQIEWKLGTEIIGRRLSVWNRMDSTQTVAAGAAHCAANHGLAVLAEEQTAGRGRRGHRWLAPPRSSILVSVLVFPPPTLREQSWLTAWGAVAIGQVVEEVGRRNVHIKRPNDVLVDGRKLAGILVEQCGSAYAVGIGLNVNIPEHAFPPELRATATSLARIGGRAFDRSDLARRLLQRLDALYLSACRHDAAPLWNWWHQRTSAEVEPIGSIAPD
jgi:BirA family biotin operon repressor/biotin-[acetyl-CoA-carboxylase] ligase